jgi:hypothetical protein
VRKQRISAYYSCYQQVEEFDENGLLSRQNRNEETLQIRYIYTIEIVIIIKKTIAFLPSGCEINCNLD